LKQTDPDTQVGFYSYSTYETRKLLPTPPVNLHMMLCYIFIIRRQKA